MTSSDNILPAELWRHIFRHSTYSYALDVDLSTTTKHIPFYNSPHRVVHRDAARLATLSIKLQIILVCQLWHDIGVEFLYEDVTFVLHRAEILIHSVFPKYGKYVQRLKLLPLKSTDVRPVRGQLTDILRLCRNIKIVVKVGTAERQAAQRFFSPSLTPDEVVEVPKLLRIDWEGGRTTNADIDDSLWPLLLLPSARPTHLSICSDSLNGNIVLEPATFDQVTSLRLVRFMPNPPAQFPKLTHLSTTSSLLYYNPHGDQPSLLEASAPQLQSLEIEYDRLLDLSTVFQKCVNLQELIVSYHSSFLAPHAPTPTSLVRIRIAGPGEDWQVQQMQPMLEMHIFNMLLLPLLNADRFPALKHLVLHGGWRSFLELNDESGRYARIERLLESFATAGISVEREET